MTAQSDRVVVTGTGALSSFGSGSEALWRACLAGEDPSAPVPASWSTYYRATSRTWAPLPPMNFSAMGFSRADVLTMSMPALLCAAASDEAMREAGATDLFRAAGPGALRAGVFVGTGFSGAKAPFDNYRAHLFGGMKSRFEQLLQDFPDDADLTEHVAALKAHARVNPLVICQTMPNAPSATVGIRFGLKGPNDTVCYACASGTVAIGRAYQAIKRGELNFAIAGGVEHLRDNAGGVFMGFDRLQTLAKPGAEQGAENRPFDRARTGFLFSEGGAGMLVLESASFARARGAAALAEVRGFALTSDAVSMVSISEDNNSICAMWDRLLEDARLAPTDIGYLNAHGTATEINDQVESALIERYFGVGPKINNTKSILGHTLGASGALEAIVTIKSLREQRVHVSRNLDHPIRELDFCKVSAAHPFDFALSESFGFGGHNAGLIFARVDHD